MNSYHFSISNPKEQKPATNLIAHSDGVLTGGMDQVVE